LTIDNQEIFAPNNNPEVTEHIFNEDDSIFITGYCDFLTCDIIFNISTNSFDITELLELGSFCTNQDDAVFNFYYYPFLQEYLEGFNPYLYEFSINNGVRFLELTNANGTKALYAN
jgi:hypothetical protein